MQLTISMHLKEFMTVNCHSYANANQIHMMAEFADLSGMHMRGACTCAKFVVT